MSGERLQNASNAVFEASFCVSIQLSRTTVRRDRF